VASAPVIRIAASDVRAMNTPYPYAVDRRYLTSA